MECFKKSVNDETFKKHMKEAKDSTSTYRLAIALCIFGVSSNLKPYHFPDTYFWVE